MDAPAPSSDGAEWRARCAPLRVAFVHDWLLGMRGGEKVLEALLELFPRAEIYTLFHDPAGVSDSIGSRPIHPSPLNRLPGVKRYYRNLLPLLPSTIERLELGARHDLVISTSHCVAHGAIPPPGVRHVTYCFSPMRYLYDQAEAYAEGGPSWKVRALGLLADRLRGWDADAARRCGEVWAISRFVADRLERVWSGCARPRVIHPPVDADYFSPGPPDPALAGVEGEYDLIVSALAPYKRVDLAIEAARLAGRRLVIAGSGEREAALRELATNGGTDASGATSGATLLGWVDAPRLRALYRGCRALIFPGEEDFGIVPLEAMACGKPVLGLRAGGLLETLPEGVAGAFFEGRDAASLAEAWSRFDAGAYDPRTIRAHAGRFARGRFLDEFARALFDPDFVPPSASGSRADSIPADSPPAGGIDWT